MMDNTVRIKFTASKESTPEEMPMMDDDRDFLFVANGELYAGYHFSDDLFKDVSGTLHEAEAWVQWEEI